MNTEAEESDLEFEITETPPEEEALPLPKYEIFSYPADTTLKGYKDQWMANQLVVPEFQRAYVWDQVRASKLIESFLLGLPVPPVFLYRASDKKAYLIIDGHQRIRSAVDFQRGHFGDKRFTLRGVADQWNGKAFDDLDEADKFQIETAVLRGIVIQQTNPKDNKSIYQIFERLNTGGVRLNPMEVRNCVSYGNFLKDLRNLNVLPSWRALLGLPKADKRFKDIELILRVLALYFKIEQYEKPMKGFLNDFATEMNKKEKAEYQAAIDTFRAASDNVFAALGEKPFHLRGRLNFSVLDAVMVAAMHNPQSPDLKKKYGNLLLDEDFVNSYTYNTSDEKVLVPRIKKAIGALA